jgi:glyoxylase-like metal-dependent hydrolase (beta-lactamase superfamily II)
MEVRVISIGALSAHPLWNEKGPVRVGHATTTLIRADKAIILVDPALPEAALTARLRERANVQPAEITHVFLTSFRPDTHRGITAFDRAEWLIHQDEREGVGQALVMQLKKLAEGEMSADDRGIRESLEQDVAILQRCKVVAESIVERVDIFPLPGVNARDVRPAHRRTPPHHRHLRRRHPHRRASRSGQGAGQRARR